MEAWNEARAEQEYVRGAETYAALALRWGCEESAVRKAGREGGWHQKRMEDRQKLRQEQEPGDILRQAAIRLCRCAGEVARELEEKVPPVGRGDLKTLHDAAALLKDLAGLLQNLKGEKEEKMDEVIFRLEGELNGFGN